MSRKPILITGSHRSGTTWVGQMLSLPADIIYIHEPFNIDIKKTGCEPEFPYRFTYVDTANEKKYMEPLQEMLDRRCPQPSKSTSRWTRFYWSSMLAGRLDYWYKRIPWFRPLMKDPIALFSSEWLSERFDMDVVVMIRQPASFVGSIKKAEWEFPFDHILQQPRLIQRYLSGFEAEILDYTNNKRSIVEQAVLLWKLFHTVIDHYRVEKAQWIFLRQEDVASEPVKEYKNLYKRLGITYKSKYDRVIESHSHVNGSNARLTKYSHIVRESSSTVNDWKDRLSHDEYQYVMSETAELALKFYTREELGI